MTLKIKSSKNRKSARISFYFSQMHKRAIGKIKILERKLTDKRKECDSLREEIKSKLDYYKTNFGVNLMDYEEFVNNTYTTGKFKRAASFIYSNRKGKHTLVIELYDIIVLANLQKKISELNEKLRINKILASLSLYQYERIVGQYYNKVQELLIRDAKGYSFAGRMGWTCINRYKLKKPVTLLDYKATRVKKQQCINEGKRIYNKEDAKWCEEHNIPYDAVDYRVFTKLEYNYELPLIGNHIKSATSCNKIKASDYIGSELREKDYDDMIKMCHNNIDEIMDLHLDIRRKLALCLKINPLIYTKYIRNENQESYRIAAYHRQNRQ